MCSSSKQLVFIVGLLVSCLSLTLTERKSRKAFLETGATPSEKSESLKFPKRWSFGTKKSSCPQECVACNSTHVSCLNNHHFSSIPQTFPETIEYLELIDNTPHNLPGGTFKRYRNLRTLNISYSRSNSHWIIHNDSFIGLNSLKQLVLKDLGSLMKIAPHSFRPLGSLRYLDFSGCFNLGLNHILYSLRALPMRCTLEYLNLRYVNEHTDVNTLTLSVLRVIRRLEVQVLILDENRIGSIHSGYSHYLVSVTYLSLRRNYIHYNTMFINFIDFLFMYNLKVLDIGANSQLPLRKEPPYNQRNIPVSCEFFFPKNMEEFYADDNQIKSFYKFYGNGLCVTQPNKLRVLTLSRTYSWGFGKPLRGLNALKYLNVQQAKIKFMDPDTFNCKYFPAIETLLLGDIDLTPTFGRIHKNSRIFQNCSNMVSIDLQNTNFQMIPKETFHDMSQVEFINISSNYIKKLDINLERNSKLRLLNVSFNLIKYFSPSIMDQLDNIAAHHDLVVDLQQNPLLCGCEQLEFIKWMKSTSAVFHNFASYSCLHEDDYYQVKTLSLSDMQYKCKVKLIKISSSISAIFLFITIICVVVYVKRHRLEYLFLLSRQMTRRLVTRSQSRDNRVYKYHGFVCWSSHEDISLIVLIQRKLEIDFGLRLAIGDREFEIGGYIVDNIVHFITVSRKTIIFLSNNFLASKWCMFELQVAMNRSLEAGFDTIVMILLHDINDLDKSKIPPALTNYLKHKTYLQWPATSAQQPAFWLRLKDALDFGEIQNDQDLVNDPGENNQPGQNEESHNVEPEVQDEQCHTEVATTEQLFDDEINDTVPLLQMN